MRNNGKSYVTVHLLLCLLFGKNSLTESHVIGIFVSLFNFLREFVFFKVGEKVAKRQKLIKWLMQIRPRQKMYLVFAENNIIALHKVRSKNNKDYIHVTMFRYCLYFRGRWESKV